MVMHFININNHFILMMECKFFPPLPELLCYTNKHSCYSNNCIMMLYNFTKLFIDFIGIIVVDMLIILIVLNSEWITVHEYLQIVLWNL